MIRIIAQVPGRAATLIMPDPGGLDKKTVKYVMADASVALVECSHCGAPAGELCRGLGGRPTLSCHMARHYAARRLKRRLRANGHLQQATHFFTVVPGSTTTAVLPYVEQPRRRASTTKSRR